MIESKVDSLQSAQEYAARGWQVFRVIPPQLSGNGQLKSFSKKDGKVSRGKWKSEATCDAGKVTDLWAQHPDDSIGVRTGDVSRIFVLDVDGEAGRASLEKLEKQNSPLPETLTATTGRGRHMYFRCPAGIRIPSSVGKLGEGLDIRSEGAYVIAPPSYHASGKRYEWVDPDAEAVDAPAWLLGLATTEDVTATECGSQDAIAEGTRNTALFKKCCALLQSGMSFADTRMAALMLNAERCSPPLAESEVLTIVASAARYPRALKDKTTKRRNPLYWFRFSALDFLSCQEVILMPDYILGWHTRLTATAWLRAGILPDDFEKLFKLSGASSRKKFREESHLALFEFEHVTIDGQPVLLNRSMASQWADTLDSWMQKKAAPSGSKTEEARVAA